MLPILRRALLLAPAGAAPSRAESPQMAEMGVQPTHEPSRQKPAGVFSDPFGWYAERATRRPRLMFFCAWTFVIALCAAGLPYFEQTESSEYDWLIGTDETVRRSYALKSAQEDLALYSTNNERSVKNTDQLLQFVYEAEGNTDNLLTPTVLAEMMKIEKMFYENAKFASYCHAQSTDKTKCAESATASAITRLFYKTTIQQDANGNTAVTQTPVMTYVDFKTTFSLTTPLDLTSQAAIDAHLAFILSAPNGLYAAALAAGQSDLIKNTGAGIDAALADSAKLLPNFFDATWSATNLKTKYIQSFYFLGLPLSGYANPYVSQETQSEPGNDLIVQVSDELKLHFGMKETLLKSPFQSEATFATTANERVKVYWFSQPVMEKEWELISNKDLRFAILSFIGVGMYMAYHTRSVLISLTSMSMTVCSIFVAFFLFRVVCQIVFFQFINFLIIFVVLGIGADDVFVFMDAFHQSLDELQSAGEPATLPHRIRHTMKRALHAIFVTSLTTAGAFCATALSPLVPLRSFGVFSAMVILCVFTLNALILPPLTVMYTRSLAGRGWCASILIVCTFGLCGTKKYEDPGESLNGSQYVVGVDEPAPPPPPPLSNNPFLKMVASPAQQPSPASQNPNNPFAATSGSQNPNNPFAATSGPVVEGATPSVEEKLRPDPAEKRDTKKLRFTERFFYQHYYKFLKSPARFLVLLAFAGLFFLGAYLWLQLDLPTEPEQWFPADHMFQQYQELATNKVFSAAPTLVNVSIVWGIGGVDDSNTNPWIPSDLGNVVYAENFDPSTAAAQAYIMRVYETLKTAACAKSACVGSLLINPLYEIRNILGQTSSTGALNSGFYYWLNCGEGNGYSGVTVNSLNPTVGSASSGYCQTTCGGVTVTCSGTATTVDPTTNPLTGDAFNAAMCAYANVEDTKVQYPSHVGFFTSSCATSPASRASFMLMDAASSLRMPVAPVAFKEVRDAWNDFAATWNADAPSELGAGSATSTNPFWLWSVTSLSLMDNVYLGFKVCFPMVFVVLSISTCNVVLAFYSTVTIAGIVTTVIGVGAGGIQGWDLGTAEAIAAVIVIGFSVDYCVHLANAYIENDAVDRQSRTRSALTTMGISVTAGAITTIIAGVFLSMCILLFFVKFSFLICWTIFSSYVWAVVFFGALCMTAGPSGNFGDISWVFDALFCRKKKD